MARIDKIHSHISICSISDILYVLFLRVLTDPVGVLPGSLEPLLCTLIVLASGVVPHDRLLVPQIF